MTMYGVPSGSAATSITRTTWSLSIRDAARASRRKRDLTAPRCSASSTLSMRKILIASRCPIAMCLAETTTPIPPAPISSSTRYFSPITSPGERASSSLAFSVMARPSRASSAPITAPAPPRARVRRCRRPRPAPGCAGREGALRERVEGDDRSVSPFHVGERIAAGAVSAGSSARPVAAGPSGVDHLPRVGRRPRAAEPHEPRAAGVAGAVARPRPLPADPAPGDPARSARGAFAPAPPACNTVIVRFTVASHARSATLLPPPFPPAPPLPPPPPHPAWPAAPHVLAEV